VIQHSDGLRRDVIQKWSGNCLKMGPTQIAPTILHALGMNPRPKIPVPLITPWLSALWLGLVTSVDTNVARPLVEGLTTATVVTDPGPARRFAVEPVGFDIALRRALDEEDSTEAAA